MEVILKKFILVSQHRASVVEGKVGKKFITAEGTRFTISNGGSGGYVAVNRNGGSWYSTYLYDMDSEHAKSKLAERMLDKNIEKIKSKVHSCTLEQTQRILELLQ